MTDYSELKRLAEAATHGPWGYDGSYVCPTRTDGGTTYVELWSSIADCHQPENTKFIAAANPAAVLALIAESEDARRTGAYWKDEKICADAVIDQFRAELEALRKALTYIRDTSDDWHVCEKAADALVDAGKIPKPRSDD